MSEVVEMMNADNIVLETDSPYLAPTPHRGKRNESSFLIHVADKVAEFRGMTTEEVRDMSTANAKLLFNL